MAAAAEDERFMAAAIRLARRNLGLTATNPSVACLIVRDGIVLGSAVTAPGGRPHAETQALAEAGEAARGATAYVTLEPCAHHGRTPPCADALIAAGVARVVVSVDDPDARVAGQGFERLRAAGIAVETRVLEGEGRRALAGYLMRQTKKRPHVTLKLAVSADGMLGRPGEGQVAITGPVSRGQVHVLRAESDAILVGIGTARADDPELTCRLPGMQPRSPVRIVLDPRLELPLTSKLVRTAASVPVIAVADRGEEDAHDIRRAALEAEGVEVLRCDPRRLEVLLEALATRGISSLLVEGGARTAQSFLAAGLVDRILLFAGPAPIGRGGVRSPCVPGEAPDGFLLRGSARYGADTFEDYERDD
ncbi:bifunctional diaminohydroxyphosphoribosylaminopyrimidine deaminase/5-amino-6-(5-phosphoribosylamino)uracil reductase RibD [Rhizobium sp. TRM95111]|uniref:bifunctional diaminohydroxyphosphoribosylaminopyrimidine deaminase/5-amino-6-(5-phosphoribosylamino)uracil reductase RibD n=1 Tax=Rhizobium alarense TaxID=2846851 RepID=UPI001F032B3A|nr:bifunctional diaminohydroxyphosphoribosylaminopyrimidine deaminase/5-amino-6-(5-phosphoribosylamino)uracil reductase RibD [Rhizobium alarense]MCF3639514.1 bifunctional diaminohydroxyphosphoribosylaminopyrimidine deaminase/5-amino-6-(5-phosphoribosylamino)uracil reductase RibD [Rhizobium alarense]